MRGLEGLLQVVEFHGRARSTDPGSSERQPICQKGWVASHWRSQSVQNVSHRRRNGYMWEYLEDGLHLVELSPGVLSCEHLDDQTTDAPYISLLGVCDLSDHLGSHPIDGALEGRTV